MSLEKKLSFWINNNYNVLFKGKHGVGKTSMIIEAFEKAGLKWMYFSASTMDPWVDFIGVPKEVKDPTNGKSYLELIRPKQFQDDEVEALFFDEYNRAPKKVRNAVMELIQFKSINGKKFSKLKIVWAAINPDDDDQKYDVEELDPAQIDRFHVCIDIPYAPSAQYFKTKYGEDMADVALTWWKEMGADIKKEVSPRRLDYALQLYKAGGDIRDVLSPKANINKLMMELTYGSISKKMKKVFDDKDADEAKKFFSVENNYSACVDHIAKKKEYVQFFLPILSDERVSSLISKYKLVEDHACNNPVQFESVLEEIAKANTNRKLAKRIKEVLKSKNSAKVLAAVPPTTGSVVKHFTPVAPASYGGILSSLNGVAYTTQQRISHYNTLHNSIPVTMTLDEAKRTLEILQDVVIHSQLSTIKHKFPKLIPMINHTVSIIVDQKAIPAIDSRAMKTLSDNHKDFIYNVAAGQQVTTATPAQATPAKSPWPSNFAQNSNFGPRNW
ncbi:MAG TPA: MoxR family ATPase [Anaerovoracaceae bacterium]|nr:MoxR family ATPase [Anaerovoracaceae bacterium]